MRAKKALLFFSSLIVCFGLSVAADRVAGVLSARTASVIFPPHVKRQFRAAEFSFNVETNSLGFRDREFDSDGRAGYRVLALGDSFTYGWGVEIGESWPKVLESGLRAGGRDAEVANLGRPGGSPKDYADIAEEVTPLLKPDLIVVAVLQGDDLAQMEDVTQSAAGAGVDERAEVKKSARERLGVAAEWLYPNFFAQTRERAAPLQTLDVQWKDYALTYMKVMTPENRTRFETLDARVKDLFMSGELNPSLVYLGVTQPDYFALTLETDSERVQTLVAEMAKHLERIKKVALENGAAVVVVSVPYGAYVSRRSLESRGRLGFHVTPEMLSTGAADEAIGAACLKAGLPFHNVTAGFRRASADLDLYFDLDGHFNVAGQRHFGEAVVPLVEKMMSAAQRPTP